MRKGTRAITQWTISSILWHEDKEELLLAIARFELYHREQLFMQHDSDTNRKIFSLQK